jgi:predicted  nucleic acid-binding Zn-ribbon protein
MSERFAQVDQRFAQMDQRFAQMDQRFAQMDQRFDDLRDLLAHTFALSTTNHLKSRQHDQLQQFNEGEHQRLTGRVDELERRLVKVEKKLES